MLSNSTWDRSAVKKLPSPSFIKGASKISYEFENRKSSKIFSHVLGRVEFREGLDKNLTSGRNEQIDNLYDSSQYKSISHVHIKPTLLGGDLSTFIVPIFKAGVFEKGVFEESITILAHGVPIGSGLENCAMAGAECAGTGTDKNCERGKCKIGKIAKVGDNKWIYRSFTVPGLYYFVFGTESVTLLSITRGRFNLPSGAGVINVPRIASVPATIYLPPSTYETETFTRRVIVKRYSESQVIRSLTDSVDNFIRSLLGTSQGDSVVEQSIRDRLLETLKEVLNPVWFQFVTDSINSVWNESLTNREFAIGAYNSLTNLYLSGVEVMTSGLKGSKVSIDERIGRPVYGRLPGVEGTYNNLDEPDTPAKWLTSGADDMLSGVKHTLDNFYRTYLNPETCYPLNLDWIAQHLGFTGGLWNLEWPNSTKRLLLRNSHTSVVSGSMWTTDPNEDTLRKIDMARIERIDITTGTGLITTQYRYSGRVYNTDSNLTSISIFDSLVVDLSRWQGILPSRGSMLTLLFMLWSLNIKAHSPEELEYLPGGGYNVKSGLRDNEINAPVNLPYTVDVLKVGSDTDSQISNYPNQLIAGIGTCQDELSSNTTILRMPFYYNRNGKSWDAATSIMDNYAPSTSINRVQYAYAVADLLVADDIFFEPKSVERVFKVGVFEQGVFEEI